ncbi:MAG: SUMF1/EgtB/PvdO family nonheme iron enzyme [Bacteroidaceae bacterium]|nr:SUMF1/EgtB/PvdO family nonheme iron enzyme [Bacteroidaceae bacterium]
MNKIKHTLLLLAAALLPMSMGAQVINGDLNHNTVLDVGDVTMVIDGYLTGTTEVVGPEVNHYYVDYNMLAGTWYRSKTDSFTLNSDGTTDYGKGYTYKFLPSQGCILFFNSAGRAATYLKVIFLPADKSYLVVKAPDVSNVQTYYNQPIQPVESITLSQTSLALQLDSDPVRLTATVSPADADNTSYEWVSSDEDVVTVSNRGTVEAVGEGTATITCTALDGFGASATCEVTVGGTAPTPTPTHAYVDLGLSVKWATMNIGANAPEEYGDYFAWGETTTKTDYSWSTYKWCQGTEKTLTKYNTSSDYSYTAPDNKNQLDLEDDAAHANWGGTWRMPTDDELTELREKCKWTWTTLNDVKGFKVEGPSGNSIFLHAAGYYRGSSVDYVGSNVKLWSSSLNKFNPTVAWYVNCSSNGSEVTRSSNLPRCYGYSVRAVCSSSATDITTYTVNSVSFKMVSVTGGTFLMGAQKTSSSGTNYDADAYDDEAPVHNVTLSNYQIGETEVTQALWKTVMGSNPSFWQGNNLPVEKVSWNDCQEFITKLNALTGKTFRLPTEAEWEFAARGGTKSQGYKYSGSNTIGDVAWYTENSGWKTHEVGTKQANELGLYDMSGNVHEWCQDWSGSYSSSAQSNPTGAASGFLRVIRGGSWDGANWEEEDTAANCRVTVRGSCSPTVSFNNLGFRLAL